MKGVKVRGLRVQVEVEEVGMTGGRVGTQIEGSGWRRFRPCNSLCRLR